MVLLRPVLIVLSVLHVCSGQAHSEHYDESLDIKPLRDGRVLTRFSFTTLLEGGVPRDPALLGEPDAPQHYTLFPLALGQILRTYAATELDLTLNAGKWSYSSWGLPLEQGIASGAELRVWLGVGGPVSVDERWKSLRNALAGLFCTSLASMDTRRTTSPTLTFPPSGDLPLYSTCTSNTTQPTYALRHAFLPSENVCTENLTPLLKLLPCGGKSGLASLLEPHRVFDADWHGLGVHVRWRAPGEAGAKGGVEVRLALQAVVNPVRLSSQRRRDWSLESLFGRKIERACPAARSSIVTVDTSMSSDPSQLTPEHTYLDDNKPTYDILSTPKPLNVAMSYPSELSFVHPTSPPPHPLSPLSVSRTVTTTSQYAGTLLVSVTNPLDEAQTVLYAETLPWLLVPYLHTLRVSIDGIDAPNAFELLNYTPTAHSAPTLLQAHLHIPAGSTLDLSLKVTKTFLKYTDHMPDAQRGWDVPGAVFVLSPPTASATDRTNTTGGAGRTYMYTQARLVDVATPDFSMPYNVTMMTCTLLAVLFGNVLKLLTRKWVGVIVEEESEPAEGALEEEKVDKKE